MVIGIIGTELQIAECTAKLGAHHTYVSGLHLTLALAKEPEVIFDFSEEFSQEALHIYRQGGTCPIFINAVFGTLTGIFGTEKINRPIFGFCGLPGFFNRDAMEVSLLAPSRAPLLKEIGTSLNLTLIQVKDQPGLVSCRVVCMIINEAFEALQQGVASQSDIDLSMKLGTNYPFGPFEWAEKIGRVNIKRILNAIVATEGDTRYTPCDSL